jgi:hypothetical protein
MIHYKFISPSSLHLFQFQHRGLPIWFSGGLEGREYPPIIHRHSNFASKRARTRKIRTSPRLTIHWRYLSRSCRTISFPKSHYIIMFSLPRQAVTVIVPRPAPSAESDRLLLRPIEESDLPAIFAIRSRPEVARFK